jgi:archaellum component FlaF (FlaF/FlaG flagellin family)
LLAKKKAVSGAISAMFVVLVFMIAIAALYTYQINYDAYLDEVHSRNQRDWERNNEKIGIVSLARLNDGSLNLTVQNLGPIAIHLTTLWVSAYDGDYMQYQFQYGIKYNENPEKGGAWFDSAETLTNLGQNNSRYSPYRLIDTYTVPGVLETTDELAVILKEQKWHYIVKLETARGNVFVGNYGGETQNMEWSDGSLEASIIITPPTPESPLEIRVTNMGSRDIWITSASLIFDDGTIEQTTKPSLFNGEILRGDTKSFYFDRQASNPTFVALSGFDDLGKPYFQRLQI